MEAWRPLYFATPTSSFALVFVSPASAVPGGMSCRMSSWFARATLGDTSGGCEISADATRCGIASGAAGAAGAPPAAPAPGDALASDSLLEAAPIAPPASRHAEQAPRRWGVGRSVAAPL